MDTYSITQLTSLPAVIAAAVFLTYLAKRLLGSVPIAEKIPTWVYTATIAGALAYVANQVSGSLPGQTGTIVIDAIIYGAMASGVRTWAQSITSPIEDSATARKAASEARRANTWVLPLLLAGSIGVTGCAGLTPAPVSTAPTAAQAQQTRATAVQVAKAVESIGHLVVEARRATGAAYEAKLITIEQRNAVYRAVIDLEPRAHALIDVAATVTTDPQLRSTVRALMTIVDDLLARLADGNSAMATIAGTIRTALTVASTYLGGGL